jgi:hypothetical protein
MERLSEPFPEGLPEAEQQISDDMQWEIMSRGRASARSDFVPLERIRNWRADVEDGIPEDDITMVRGRVHKGTFNEPRGSL